MTDKDHKRAEPGPPHHWRASQGTESALDDSQTGSYIEHMSIKLSRKAPTVTITFLSTDVWPTTQFIFGLLGGTWGDHAQLKRER